jgi:hypothetical protein
MGTIAVATWADLHQVDGEFSYFFEAGHKSQNESNEVMASLFGIRVFRYKSHAFVKKEEARPIQSADILAWQTALYRKRLIKHGNAKPRADFRSLVARDTVICYGTKERFDKVHDQMLEYLTSPDKSSEDLGNWVLADPSVARPSAT